MSIDQTDTPTANEVGATFTGVAKRWREAYELASSISSRSAIPEPYRHVVAYVDANQQLWFVGGEKHLRIAVHLPSGRELSASTGTPITLPLGFEKALRGSVDVHKSSNHWDSDVVVQDEHGWIRFGDAPNASELLPLVMVPNEARHFWLPSESLSRILGQTIPLVDDESSRYALGSVLLEYDAQNFRAIATDGRRLGVADGDLGTTSVIEGSALLPGKAARLLKSLCDRGCGDVSVWRIAEDQMLFDCPGGRLVTRLGEGRFPKWQDVLPRENSTPFEIDVTSLKHVLARALVAADVDGRTIFLRFADNAVVITADRGDRSAELKVRCDYCDEPLELCLDAKFFRDGLALLRGSTPAGMKLTTADGPVLLFDDHFSYLLMSKARDR